MILRRLMKDLILPVAVAICLAFLIQAAIAKPYQIPTGSMIPTIREGDRVIANRVIYRFRDIERGDIIVFNPTEAARQSCPGTAPGVPFVKRVIGIPGDTVAPVPNESTVTVNGRPFTVEQARPNDQPRQESWTVPAGSLFVLGDNRQDSCDSHLWSDPFVPIDNVIGQAEVTYWPLRHVKFLD